MKKLSIYLFMIVSVVAPTLGWASDGQTLNLTNHWLGITALCIFAVS